MNIIKFKKQQQKNTYKYKLLLNTFVFVLNKKKLKLNTFKL